MKHFPPLFLSHGAPNTVIRDTPVNSFLRDLGGMYGKPEAIVSVSAHFETKGAYIVTDPKPETVHDFGNFEKELFELRYPANGHPDLAQHIADLISAAGIPVTKIPRRGFDHGTWVPLMLAYPEADVPIVQLSIDPEEGPHYHYRLGQALASLPKKNIAVIGTGNITHNLSALFRQGQDAELDANIKSWVDQFLDWFGSELESGNVDNILNYREKAPFAAENHPTDEHLLPIFVALGAAGEEFRANKLHASYDFEFLAMDAWEFAPKAA